MSGSVTRLPRTSILEAALEAGLRLYGADLPPHEREHRFSTSRRWRFDFAWPSHKLAIEVQGGIMQRGRTGHTSISGALRDAEKLTAAAVAGWRILVIPATWLTTRRLPGTIDTIREALRCERS